MLRDRLTCTPSNVMRQVIDILTRLLNYERGRIAFKGSNSFFAKGKIKRIGSKRLGIISGTIKRQGLNLQ